MKTAPSVRLERERLDALRSLGVLDTPPDEAYDRVVRMAAAMLETPIAMVSLVDDQRQWFKARLGLDASELCRDDAFCAHAVAGDGTLLEVPDTLLDKRFFDNPLVTGPPHIRFYAGQPLRAHGHLVGTLCVIDHKPRQLRNIDRSILRDLAGVVEEVLIRKELDVAVAAVRQSEARKDQILATMHDGLVVQDLHGAIVTWNRSAERTLGLSGDELSGRSSIDPRWQAIRPDGTPWPGDTHPAMETLRTGESVENALMGVHRPIDGLGWLRVNSTPVIEPDGTIGGVITSFADVTDLTRTDQNLRRVEHLQRLTLDVLEQGVVVALRNGHIELMNTAAQRILGYDAEELSNNWKSGNWKTFREDGTEVEAHLRPIARTFLHGERVSGELVGWDRSDGRRVLLSLSTSAIPNDSNRYMITFVDVTQRQRDRKLLELTFANAPIGMALLDHRGRFVHVNNSLCQFLRRDRETLLALRFEDVTDPADHPEDLVDVMSLLDGTRDSYEKDKRYLLPDATIAQGHLAVAVLRSTTLRNPFFLAQVIDIQDRLAAEQAKDDALNAERSAVAKLVELDRIKTDLVSTVSHELRTPLASMIGYLELLQDDTHIHDNHRNMLEVIDRNAHRLLALIENLLTLAKVELDPQQTSRTPVSTTDIIISTLSIIRPLALNGEVTIKTDLDNEVRPILANTGHVERALLNLLTNAIKFTPSGGIVTISTRQDTDHQHIRIHDTGMGIPANEIPLLFTRFFRSTTAQNQAIPGTGLGLAITRDIIENHGGTITVHSAPESGTTFDVRIPTKSCA